MRKFRQRELGAPIKALEAGILEFAEHHEREEDHERNEDVLGLAQLKLPLEVVLPENEERDGGDQPGSGGNGKAREVARAAAYIIGGGATLNRARRRAPHSR